MCTTRAAPSPVRGMCAAPALRRCAADSGMGSCFSKDIAKYIPDCKKKSDEQGEPAQVHPAAEATSSFGSAEEKKKPSGSKCLKLNTSSVCDEEEQCSWCVRVRM